MKLALGAELDGRPVWFKIDLIVERIGCHVLTNKLRCEQFYFSLWVNLRPRQPLTRWSQLASIPDMAFYSLNECESWVRPDAFRPSSSAA
jgi:hypothetical protein